MCGIFGSIGFEPDSRRIDIVAHRGPDGRGWETYASPKGPVALGHRRLAIIDVSDAGLQPMCDASRRYWLVFNGEIYNYIELREEMRGRARFSSPSPIPRCFCVPICSGGRMRCRGYAACSPF